MLLHPDEYRRVERRYRIGRDERPIERRRRQRLSTFARWRRQRRWRREGRPTFNGIHRSVAAPGMPLRWDLP